MMAASNDLFAMVQAHTAAATAELSELPTWARYRGVVLYAGHRRSG